MASWQQVQQAIGHGTPAGVTTPNQPVEVRRGVLCYVPPADMDEELANDLIALGCYDVFAERGIVCPDEISVVGFNDMPFADRFQPPLTTIRQNCHVGARLLVEKLMRAIRHEHNESVVIPTELVVRGSGELRP